MSVKVKLTKPVELAGQTYDHLNVKEPLAKHLDALPINSANWRFSDLRELAKQLVDVDSPAVVDNLSVKDLESVMLVVTGFLGGGPETGEKSTAG